MNLTCCNRERWGGGDVKISKRRVPQDCSPVTEKLSQVASTYLCKFEERFSFPGPVQVTDDAVDDAVAAFHIGEARHGARSSAHFTEGALDDVGGAHLDPVLLRDGEKV